MATRERTFDFGTLRRLAIWGSAAALALLLAVAASYSEFGARRLAAAEAQRANAAPPQLASRLPEFEGQLQRLTAVVDALTADRERLATRLNSIERNLDDITGAVKRQAVTAAVPPSPAAPPPAAAPPAPAPTAALPLLPLIVPSPPPTMPVPAPIKEAAKEAQPAPTAPPTIATRPAPPASPPERTANAPAPAPAVTTPAAPAADAEVAKSEFAVDVGGAANFDGLRVLWGSTKGASPTLVEGLHPRVAVRENSRTRGAELRLVLGPLGNVEAASRLCDALAAAHRYCQPVPFEGQRLAEADTTAEPAPKTAPATKPRSLAPPPAAAAPPPSSSSGSNLPKLFR